jgi:hypothetical protein
VLIDNDTAQCENALGNLLVGHSYSYIDDVIHALILSGGEARLEDIIEVVMSHRTKRGATTGHLKEWVWNTLQKNSEGRGRNIFEPVRQDEESKVIWRLRSHKTIERLP